MTDTSLDTLCVNTIRTLAMDAVQQANSGHPGTPMAMAPVAYALWQRQMRFDPEDPIWPNRDRFVLSMGHASMLLYSLLHLTGVKAVNPEYETLGTPAVTLDDIRHFRQLDSKCPGHPEYHWTSGVETTTGPLGQGVATSVGMAIAGRWLAARYNRPDYPLFDYDVYALGGDGCMMEGVSGEAASLAGHLRLANLCWIYDNNHITIEGHTDLAFSDDVATDSGEGRWTLDAAIDEAVPAHVLAAALFERFASRGEADFQDRLLSAMRFEFGGHLRCPRRRSSRSPITARSAPCCRTTAAMPRRCSTASRRRASTSTPSRPTSSARGRPRSSSPGTTCWPACSRRARRSGGPAES